MSAQGHEAVQVRPGLVPEAPAPQCHAAPHDTSPTRPSKSRASGTVL